MLILDIKIIWFFKIFNQFHSDLVKLLNQIIWEKNSCYLKKKI